MRRIAKPYLEKDARSERGTYARAETQSTDVHTQAENPEWASLSCALYSHLYPYDYPSANFYLSRAIIPAPICFV